MNISLLPAVLTRINNEPPESSGLPTKITRQPPVTIDTFLTKQQFLSLAEHMGNGSLLAFGELAARAWPIRIAERPAAASSLAGYSSQPAFQRQHLLRRRHRAAFHRAANQRAGLHLAGNAFDRHRSKTAF